MSVRPRGRIVSMPTTGLELSRILDDSDVEASDGTVTDDSFAPRTGNTVIGRSANTSGTPADIGIGQDQFLVNRGGVLTGGGLLLADIPAGVSTDSERSAGDAAVTTAFQAADSAHVAASDPHTQYRLESVNVPYTEVSSKPAFLGLIYSGTGSPESVVTAGMGSLYLRTDGGAGTTVYAKSSGAGNTGWLPLS